MKKLNMRFGVGFSACIALATVSSLALADGAGAPHKADGQCSGEHGGKRSAEDRAKHAAERFQKSDKNADGFLTQAEVGDKRWTRIAVADANRDGKVSQAELAQARAEGKLGHGKRDKRPA